MFGPKHFGKTFRKQVDKDFFCNAVRDGIVAMVHVRDYAKGKSRKRLARAAKTTEAELRRIFDQEKCERRDRPSFSNIKDEAERLAARLYIDPEYGY